MWQELAAIFRHIQTDPEVGAVVLSGEGRCFTAGLDCASLPRPGALWPSSRCSQ